jgi:hypothetical protein
MDRLSTGVVLIAEAYVFELERRGFLKAGPFVPEAVLSKAQTAGPGLGISAVAGSVFADPL